MNLWPFMCVVNHVHRPPRGGKLQNISGFATYGYVLRISLASILLFEVRTNDTGLS